MERAGFKHGFDPILWEKGKAEARAVMYDIARRKRAIAYSDLVNRVQSVRMEPHDPRLAHFLGQIAREDDESGYGLTTVVVVHKNGDMQPGPGFFEMATGQGRDVADIEQFWIDELNRVYDHWAGHYGKKADSY